MPAKPPPPRAALQDVARAIVMVGMPFLPPGWRSVLIICAPDDEMTFTTNTDPQDTFDMLTTTADQVKAGAHPVDQVVLKERPRG